MHEIIIIMKPISELFTIILATFPALMDLLKPEEVKAEVLRGGNTNELYLVTIPPYSTLPNLLSEYSEPLRT